MQAGHQAPVEREREVQKPIRGGARTEKSVLSDAVVVPFVHCQATRVETMGCMRVDVGGNDRNAALLDGGPKRGYKEFDCQAQVPDNSWQKRRSKIGHLGGTLLVLAH